MTEITLGLKFTSRPQRMTSAQFVPFGRSADWLAELTAWQIPLEHIRIYPVPRSRGDNSCLGALITYEGGKNPHSSGQTQPYGRVGKQVYLPVEARLTLELSEGQWQSLVSSDTETYVWHPQAGLVAFGSNDVLRVGDLVARAKLDRAADHDWGHAQSGMIFTNRITSLRVQMPPSADSMLSDGRGDIGTHSKEFGALPAPLSDNLKSLGKSAAGMALAPFTLLAGLMAKMLAGSKPGAQHGTGDEVEKVQPPGSVSEPGILQKAINWLRGKGVSDADKAGAATGGGFAQGLQQFANWAAGLLDARQLELNRLMKLLQEDPDEGLKYALPMGGDAGRGVANPSSFLLPHQVDFRLGGRGSGAADVWNMPPEMQWQLTQRYRDLAVREIQLGRYRRAAYIYAELLGDLSTAAQTLVNGRFFREAAVLYRDKLNRPLDAARCLEQGGLLHEAIPLYQQQGQFEIVGDLHQRLDEMDQAYAAYRQAVAKTMERRDHLGAARLLDEKLHVSDEALEILDRGWPGSDQARRCLEASFLMRTRLGRHDESVEIMNRLRTETLPHQRAVEAVEVLAATATDAPHARSRAVAADCVRHMASAELAKTSSNTSRQQLTNAVRRLAQQDRLLARDCQRAVAGTGSKRRAANEIPTLIGPKRDTLPRLVRTFQLPTGVDWRSACETDRNFYVAGWKGKEVVVARGSWNDPQAVVTTVSQQTFTVRNTNFVLYPSPSERSLAIGNSEGWTFMQQEFPSTDAAPDREIIETPPWLAQQTSALAGTPTDIVFAFRLMEMLVTSYGPQRVPTAFADINAPVLDRTFDPQAMYPMVARQFTCYLGVDQHLFEIQAGKEPVKMDFLEPIRCLAVNPPQTASRLVVLFDKGFYFHWEQLGSHEGASYDNDLEDPLAVFLRDGRMVVIGKSVSLIWKVYATADRKLQTEYEVACEVGGDVIALLRPGLAKHVGLCTSDGKVRLYEV